VVPVRRVKKKRSKHIIDEETTLSEEEPEGEQLSPDSYTYLLEMVHRMLSIYNMLFIVIFVGWPTYISREAYSSREAVEETCWQVAWRDHLPSHGLWVLTEVCVFDN